MCAACVAQGAVYVGGATVALRGLAFRARRRAVRAESEEQELPDPDAAGRPRT